MEETVKTDPALEVRQLPTSNAVGLARKLGLERAMRAVTVARKYSEAGDRAQRFDREEVDLLVSVGQSRILVEDLAAAVRKLVADALA